MTQAERLVARRAIDRCRFLEILGDRVEVALEVPDGEWQQAGDDRDATPASEWAQLEGANLDLVQHR